MIICRSGALTISELTACGKPSILIPLSKYAAGDHQTKNARVLAKSGAAKILSEKNLTAKKLFAIMNLIHNKTVLSKMSKASKVGKPDATSPKIVDQILENQYEI